MTVELAAASGEVDAGPALILHRWPAGGMNFRAVGRRDRWS